MSNQGTPVKINLLNSINVDTIDDDVYAYEDEAAPLNDNTGIERNGGVTNIFEKETLYEGDGYRFLTEDGQLLELLTSDTGDVKVLRDGDVVGFVSAYGVQSRLDLSGFDDVAVCPNDTALTCKLDNGSVIINEFDFDGILKRTRTINFPNLTDYASFLTSFGFVRYTNMSYDDNQEFALRLGDQLIILQESNLTATFARQTGYAGPLGANVAISDAIVYMGFLVVCGGSGASLVASFDGQFWINSSGVGQGTGPWNNSTCLGANSAVCLGLFQKSITQSWLIVAGAAGKVATFDGFNWKNADGSGTGLGPSNSGTALNATQVNAVIQFNNAIVIAGGNATSLVASWTVAGGWIAYNAAGTGATALANNNTANLNKTIRRMAIQGNALAFGSDSGLLSSVTPGGFSMGDAATVADDSPVSTDPAVCAIAISSTTMLSIAKSGSISRSTNSGNSWSPWYNSGLPDLTLASSVLLRNARTGGTSSTWYIFCGFSSGSSPIYRSIDDGLTWTLRSSQSGIAYDMDAYLGAGGNDAVVYTIGNSAVGYFYKSLDGASSFSIISPTGDTATNFFGIWLDSFTGSPIYVMGITPNGISSFEQVNGSSVVLYYTVGINMPGLTTSDNGTHFLISGVNGGTFFNRSAQTSQPFSTPVGTRSFFISGSTWITGPGPIFSTSNRLQITTNNGTSWNDIGLSSAIQFLAANWSGGTNILVSEQNGGLPSDLYQISTNSGASFNSQGRVNSWTYNASLSRASANGLTGIIAGQKLIRTLDGGATFNFNFGPSSTSNPVANFTDIANVAGIFYAIVQSLNQTYRSADGGQTWGLTGPGGTPLLLASNGSRLLLAQAANVYYTDSSGNPNTLLVATSVFATCNVRLKGTGSTWVGIGGQGFFTRSTDNGATWSAPAQISGWSGVATVTDLSVFGSVWVIVGTNGKYSVSTDNGATWSAAATMNSWGANAIRSVAHVGNVFCAVGDGANFSISSANAASWGAAAAIGSWGSAPISLNVVLAINGQFLAFGGSTNALKAAITTFSTANYTWTNYNAGSGVSDNATLISTDNISAMAIFNGSLVLGGSAGKIGSIDSLLNKKTYAGVGTGLGPFNNATVLGAVSINAFATFQTFLFVAGASGRMGYWDGSNWHAYNSGDSGTSNGTIVGASNINALALFTSSLWAFGANGIASAMGANFAIGPIYNLSGTPLMNLYTNMQSFGYNYVYRYANGQYLVNLVNNNLNTTYIINQSTLAAAILKGRFAVIQENGVLARHIITETPRFDGSDMYCMSLVGYTDFVTFTSTQQYPATGLLLSGILCADANGAPQFVASANVPLAGNGQLGPLVGFNYADFVFKQTGSATNEFNFYGPLPRQQPLSLFSVYQGNTPNAINGYGKLSNAFGLPAPVPFEIRTIWASGIGGTLAAGIIDGNGTDTLGVLLTNPGEFDDFYTPQVVNGSTVLYTFNNLFRIIKIGKTIEKPIQKLSSRLYKINTLSPLNIFDSASKTLNLGSIDYNGRMLFNSVSAPAATATNVASILQSDFANSIDVGDKLCYIPSVSSANLSIFGNRLPSQGSISPNVNIDTYIADIYAFSTTPQGVEVVEQNPQSPLYVPTTVVPLAIGADYTGEGSATEGNQTFFLESGSPLDPTSKVGYDGYQIGNSIQGNFIPFQLFGQTYLFDGEWIYLASFNGRLLSSYDRTSPATGVRFIAESPTEIFFISDFDNSLFSFSGGRNITKAKRFTNEENIIKGIFNVRDNALILETANSFMWVRDSVITKNLKKPLQASIRLYDTTLGIILNNDAGQWQYFYDEVSGSSVVPLFIQTAFFGTDEITRSILRNYQVTIFNEGNQEVTVTLVHDSFDSDKSYTQSRMFSLHAKDWNARGYTRIRFQPENQRNIGNALSVLCNSHILIHDISAQVELEQVGIPSPQGRSK